MYKEALISSADDALYHSTESAIRRSFRKAVTTVMLILMACGLFSTLAAIIAPCSVKAYGV